MKPPINTIVLPLSYFEHLLNCLATQKFIHEMNIINRTDGQKIIDTAWDQGMRMMYHAKKLSDQ